MSLIIIVYVLSGLLANAVSSPALYDQRQTGETNVRIDIQDATFIVMEGEGGDYDYSYDYSDLTVKPETDQSSTHKPISLTPPSPPPFYTTTPTTTTTTTTASTTTDSSTNSTSNSGAYVLEKENQTLTITPIKQDANSSEPNKIQILQPQQQQQPQQPLNSHNFQIPVVVIHEKIAEAEKLTAGKPPEKNYISSSEIRKKNNNNSNGNNGTSAAAAIRTEDLPQRNCALGFFLDSRNRCKKIKRPLEQRKRPQMPFGLRFAQRPEAMNA